MSYSEKDGQVVLTMSAEDYSLLLVAMGSAVGAAQQGRGIIGMKVVVSLLNRLNEGSPVYVPYVVSKDFAR